MNNASIIVGDIFTAEEITKAVTIMKDLNSGAIDGVFAQVCDEQIVKPVIRRIDAELGQKNDSRYLAYVLEYAISQIQDE